jgi:hypothetical protein
MENVRDLSTHDNGYVERNFSKIDELGYYTYSTLTHATQCFAE